METRRIVGHVLFVSVTAVLVASIYRLSTAWPPTALSVATPLTGLGLCIVVGSGVYGKRPWHRHLIGGIGLSLAIAASALRHFA